ncbi:MAG: hypothetical protein R3D56_13435 [Paracoccaceae bacterium]
MSQIVGERQFLGRSFRVTGDVDPRPDQLLVLKRWNGLSCACSTSARVGLHPFVCLAAMPVAAVLAPTLSAAALAVAAENAARLGLGRQAAFASAGIHGRASTAIRSSPSAYIAMADEMASSPRSGGHGGWRPAATGLMPTGR